MLAALVCWSCVAQLAVLAAPPPNTSGEESLSFEGLDLSSEVAPQARFLVLPLEKGRGREDVAGYRLLMAEVARQFGPQVVAAPRVLEALRSAQDEGLDARSPEGLAALTRALAVERVVVLTPQRRSLQVALYAPPEQEPLTTLTVPDALPLTAKRAARVAETLSSLSTQLVPEVAAPPPAEEEAAAAPVAEVPGMVDQDLVSEQSGRPRPAAPSGPARPPLALLGVGGGSLQRDLSVTGPLQEQLSPLTHQPLPQLVLSLTLLPLRLADSTDAQPWSDAVLEGRWRRSFAQARYADAAGQTQTCPFADDELMLRAGWRYRLGKGLPSVGLGAGWSAERSEFSCALPVVSAQYRALDVHLRLRQELLGGRLAVDLLAGAHFIGRGPGVERASPSPAAELSLTAFLTSFLFTRLHGRFISAQLSTPEGLDVWDSRTNFALELGVAL